MASVSDEHLLCPVCREVFSLPVLLKCGHNSCKVCLQQFWLEKGCRECPVCCTPSASDRPPINLQLKIAADSFQERRTCQSPDFCTRHNEKLKVFCHNDEEPICVVCQTSKLHKIHNISPVEEAAPEKKKEISIKLESLQDHLKTLNKTMEQWDETKHFIKTQANYNEKVIKEEFQKLHQFLWEEEKTRLTKLKHEEELKTQVMQTKLNCIKEQIKKLSSIISDTEVAIRARDVLFLKDYKQTKFRTQHNIPQPECIRDILIDTAKHLGSLKYDVWKKMVELVKCAPVTMDPNTAQCNLRFYEELTRVQYSSKLLLPDNPERCSSRISVLGATGFTSGKHSWTVHVGYGSDWCIGVAQESINRKSVIFLKPSEGFWIIGLCNGDTYWAQTYPRTKLVVKNKPHRITVELDYDKGKVVFINTADSTPMHTFKDKFTERVFPYFAPGISEKGKSSCPLTICPMTIAIDVQ
ncbi:zinc-binding protein A33-like [Myripristis murdjan]|uniref:zinc-binding protein A33-like n=1 Tax=Myripristis murdjan TaxID=586833 RepID=UPI0011762640|nr:zinc-binding protein A33-like [Myripristis murdjan]